MSATIGYLINAAYDPSTGRFTTWGNVESEIDRYDRREQRKFERLQRKTEKRYNRAMQVARTLGTINN